MDFNVKKIVKDAGAALSRVVQYTEEKLGTSEKTELDAHFENLWNRANTTKLWTEKILKNTEAVLVPNIGNRMEDFIFATIEKKKPSRLSNLEYLGLDMIEAGNEYGPGTAYGTALIKVGQYEQKLGQAERDFVGTAGLCYTQPLQKFLDGEMKTIVREKSLLDVKRLDLDACKNRVRKARSLLGTQTAERDLRIAQSEFDRQAEITKLLLEGIGSSHAAQLRLLYQFVETQTKFYAQCKDIMLDLQKEMKSCSATSGAPPPFVTVASPQLNSVADEDDDDFKKAKVVCDYDARDATELSLMADEIIKVKEVPNKRDDDYFIGKRNQQIGKVPKAFVEVIS